MTRSGAMTWVLTNDVSFAPVPPNYALERSVRRFAMSAAGARESLAPAAPGERSARPAQRGR